MLRNFFLLIAGLFLISSCIEIEENITIHSDRSGHIVYAVNTSDLGALITGFSGILNNSFESQIRSEVDKLIQKLKVQPGINNVKYQINQGSRDYNLSFDFKDSNSFNKALYAMGDSRKSFLAPGYLKVRQSKVKKINFSHVIAAYIKKEKIEIPDYMQTDVLTFKSVINVPEPINKVEGINTSVSSNQQKVIQEFKFSEILQDKINTSVKIKY